VELVEAIADQRPSRRPKQSTARLDTIDIQANNE